MKLIMDRKTHEQTCPHVATAREALELVRKFATLAVRTQIDETPDPAIEEMVRLADDPHTRALLKRTE